MKYFPLLIGIILLPTHVFAEKRSVCAEIDLQSDLPISFNTPELQLICDQYGPKPWQNIPSSQKKYFLKSFLQARGFYKPTFSQSKSGLTVIAGEQARIKQINLHPVFNLDPSRYWSVYGRPLTPENLDAIENWIKTEYSKNGHPCIKLETQAFAENGLVSINIQAREPEKIGVISSDSIPGMLPGIERRYDAFTSTSLYNSLQLNLAAKRIQADELVIRTNFKTNCNKPINIHQTFVTGEPRLLSFGIGFDTEELAIVETKWKNTRFTETASLLEAQFRASYRIQKIGLRFQWFYAPFPTDHYLNTTTEFTRENEKEFDSRTYQIRTGPAWKFDISSYNIFLWPTISANRIWLPRGKGEKVTSALSFQMTAQVQSHEFEFYRTNPRSGFSVGFDSEIAHTDFSSNISLGTYRFYGTHLFNVFQLEPPIWILGIRYDLAITEIGKGTTRDAVPTNRKLRLGGISNLRGFSRKSIGNDGAFTAGYIGFESRIANVFPYGLQPLFFLDLGKIGYSHWHLDPQLYASPGAGLHWQSPIGILRTTLAYGFVKGIHEEAMADKWQLYFSFGENF